MGINQVLNSLYKNGNLEEFEALSMRDKHLLLKQMFYNNNEGNIELAKKILTKIIQNEYDAYNFVGGYINLLCIILAKTHDINNLKFIVQTKTCTGTDLSCTIDSNLIFEFATSREDCVLQTKALLLDKNKVSKIEGNKEEWFKTFRDMVENYGFSYGSDLVVRYWDIYKSERFKKILKNDLEAMYPENL